MGKIPWQAHYGEMANTPKIMGLPMAITLTCLVNNYVAPLNGYGNDTRISWGHCGNITRTSWEYHDNDTGTWEHHVSI
jgi:hypothetical protein